MHIQIRTVGFPCNVGLLTFGLLVEQLAVTEISVGNKIESP